MPSFFIDGRVIDASLNHEDSTVDVVALDVIVYEVLIESELVDVAEQVGREFERTVLRPMAEHVAALMGLPPGTYKLCDIDVRVYMDNGE